MVARALDRADVAGFMVAIHRLHQTATTAFPWPRVQLLGSRPFRPSDCRSDFERLRVAATIDVDQH